MADLDVAAVIGIDAVAIRDVQFIADGHSIHEHVFATDEMKGPFRRVKKGDPLHHEIVAPGEHSETRSEGGRPPPFARRFIAGHELARSPVDPAGAGDPQTGRVARSQQRPVGGVVFRPRAREQLGVLSQVKLDATVEIQPARQIAATAGQDDPGTGAGAGRRVDRALQRRTVEGGAIAGGPEIQHVEFP